MSDTGLQVGRYDDQDAAAIWSVVMKARATYNRDRSHWIDDRYLSGWSKMGFGPTFPAKDDLDTALYPAGWTIRWADSYLSGRNFSRWLLERAFPVEARMRTLECAAHAPFPDTIHDIIGHLPLLHDEEYQALLLHIASLQASCPFSSREIEIRDLAKAHNQLALQGCDPERVELAHAATEAARAERRQHPDLYLRLNRLFLWTIEFGLLSYDGSGLRIIGAGILSSEHDTNQIMNGNVHTERLSMRATETDINFSEPQLQLYVGDSLEHYMAVFTECAERFG